MFPPAQLLMVALWYDHNAGTAPQEAGGGEGEYQSAAGTTDGNRHARGQSRGDAE